MYTPFLWDAVHKPFLNSELVHPYHFKFQGLVVDLKVPVAYTEK